MLLLLLLLYVYFFLLPQDDPERLDKVLKFALRTYIFSFSLSSSSSSNAIPSSFSLPSFLDTRLVRVQGVRVSATSGRGRIRDVIVGAPQEGEQEDDRGNGKEKQTTGTGAERWASTPSKASTSSRALRSRGSP